MNCTRIKPETHWRGVGRNAARMGMAVSAILTGKPTVDAWIKEGYGPLDEPCSICHGETLAGDGRDRGGDVTHDVCLENIGEL